MDTNINFITGLGCGVCLGISLFALKNYIGLLFKARPTARRFTSNSEYKMVLVVRTDLNMGKGKIAAQCCHAAVGAYESALKENPEALRMWERSGHAKVAVKINSLDEMRQISQNAMRLGLIVSTIRDAGRTQIAPNTVTVVGIGPAPKEIMDQVTGHLSLL